ncbi:bifunctional non-homologous end joining protein LigD [Pseudonocardia sediminis]|uniref:Bifunctional non-homologous end joining protein LigD n=1 Tax=Pseudonocardia sediminis TaxID=1397368 RepID=A0A4Q7UZ61_PSEST|nr:bifunctional non-homologous end joining protein LigD [Pseudonocardia sediminis]
MPLEDYRRKRDPQRTPEPIPETDPEASGAGERFVIQEHHATALHWDLRLERDGVLASWAVPKGLPTDPSTVRMAIRTEDHPMEYLDFAGDIPSGEYGGGHMSVWDSGRYETEKWNDREVAVVLHGERAQGRFVLLHRPDGKRDTWLLRRAKDQGDDSPSGEPLPHDAALVEPTPADALPDGPGWWIRVRFGGRRVLVRSDGGRATLTGPDGAGGWQDIALPPQLRRFGPSLGAGGHLLDAELTTGGDLWISDVLHTGGEDLRDRPLRERRERLDALPLDGPHWKVAPVYPDAGPELLDAVTAQGLPSVVAVREDSAYRTDVVPDPDWVEVPAAAPRRPAGTGPLGAGRARLTNPDKVLYPRTGTTKTDVLAHYLAVAEVMLPHIADRPLTMVRWPDGVGKPSFFEKNVARHAPDWVRTARVGTPGGRSETADFPVIDSVEGLAWAANLAALELHVPQWRLGPRDGRHPPDLVVFDLDPGEGTSIVECCRVAEWLDDVLAEHDLEAWPRTSGGKGLQLYIPVGVTRAEQTSEFAHDVADRLATDHPREVVSVMAKARRTGRVFVDWSQNNTAKTTIASYSLRGRERPTVATPVTWDEVRACHAAEDLRFVADDIPARLDRHGDLMAPLLDTERFRLPRRT